MCSGNGAAVLRVGLLLGLAGCCGHADPPCASWPQKNHNYALELVGGPVEASYLSFGSCAGLLPPPPSGTVAMTAGALTRGSGGDEGCECIPRYATFDYPGFAEVGLNESVTPPELGYAARVELDGGCQGILVFGVAEWSPADAGQDEPHDVFYREFHPNANTREQCQQLGFPRDADDGRCSDVWRVRIEDTSGPRGHG